MIFKLALPLLGLIAAACTREPAVEAELTVNYASVSGTWQMVMWNGETLGTDPDDTRYFYMEIAMSPDEDGIRRLVQYQNVNSSKSYKLESAYRLYGDSAADFIVGNYLYGGGLWEHEYAIVSFGSDSMTWSAVEGGDDVRVFRRADAVPEEIVAGTRSL